MRIVFFGSPDYAVPSLRACLALPGAEVVAVVTQPDRPRGRSGKALATPVKELALEAGVTAILQPERTRRDTTEAIAALAPDVGVVAAYGNILPTHLLEAFPHGLLNVHASLLPRHRGAAPVAAAILAGDRETGATIMQVVRALDAGPTVGEVRTPIGPLDTAGELTDRIAQLGADRLAELLPRWVAGDIEAVPQDEAQMTYAPRLTKADGYVDWDQSCEAIGRLIRAFHPWPSATTTYDNQPITIHEAWPLPALETSEAPGTVLPGDAAALSLLLPGRKARAVVVCGSGALALLRIQRPGRQAQDIEPYLNGDPALIGSHLG
ncbi:MAG: methionyl-tRNA formyltransferase [Chloroflexi bacterium]|nr:methionyl-tRNA formyltransferase [Chloroflexota bacterium]MDA1145729.1 methionyl-tRNA formyltransferase [Chloroflexota bacterium]